MDNGNTLTNKSHLSVADGANLALSGGSIYTQGTAGTLGVTVDATAGYGIVGGTDTVGGKLAVTTVGTPASGSSYNVISGASLSGTFATINSPVTYTPTYSSTGLTLTAS
jgi:hypothetical protein